MSDLFRLEIMFTDEGDRYMNAEKYGLERIYFGGCFIRGVENKL